MNINKLATFLALSSVVVSLCACNTPASNPLTTSNNSDVKIQETNSRTLTTTETIPINNCGGRGESKLTSERTVAINVGGGVGASVGYSIVQANISAKYGLTQGYSKKLELNAPPGTNMQFVLRWTEQQWTGTVFGNGQSGTYDARTPIQVEQVSATDLGCGGITSSIVPLMTSTPIKSSQPTISQPNIVSLQYSSPSEFPGVKLAPGQTQFIAIYLQVVQVGGSLESAIQSIQREAQSARASVQEGNGITVQPLQAYLVWCANADCVYPTSTDYPLKGFRQDYVKVVIIATGEARQVRCPSNCWAVAVK